MSSPAKLLLVEDEKIVRITVRDALAKAGYRVTDLADGAAALRTAESERFDATFVGIVASGILMVGWLFNAVL